MYESLFLAYFLGSSEGKFREVCIAIIIGLNFKLTKQIQNK